MALKKTNESHQSSILLSFKNLCICLISVLYFARHITAQTIYKQRDCEIPFENATKPYIQIHSISPFVLKSRPTLKLAIEPPVTSVQNNQLGIQIHCDFNEPIHWVFNYNPVNFLANLLALYRLFSTNQLTN